MLKEGREREEAEKRRRLQRTAAGVAKTGGGDGGKQKDRDRDVRARQQARQQEQQSEARRRKREKKRAQQEARQKATAVKARARAAHSQRKQKEREEREEVWDREDYAYLHWSTQAAADMDRLLVSFHRVTPTNMCVVAWVLVQVVRYGELMPHLLLSGTVYGPLLHAIVYPPQGSPLQFVGYDAVWLAGLLVFFNALQGYCRLAREWVLQGSWWFYHYTYRNYGYIPAVHGYNRENEFASDDGADWSTDSVHSD